ncbi:chromo domain-containing protein cec-1-like [Ananas comosus]|uniref:Chromo domain-containing protein cec-1-like n=1 Tax=Ananas comosus TaxID=4615 RepID=A0A199VBS2_ANACO|nr:chromo domain-containing protein cec-1-like [Ananas comosus]OAY74250.1 hypothetical protein ACMD2_17509 [Ananas comosus]
MDPADVVVTEGKYDDEPAAAAEEKTDGAAKQTEELTVGEEKTDGAVKETEQQTVELVGPEKEEEEEEEEEQTVVVEKLEPAAATAAAAVVPPADQPLPASQEAVEAAEAAAEASEASLGIDALAHEAQVRAVRGGEEAAQVITEETGESAQVNTVELARHRASWWNCCGLLDAITGSKGSTST